MLEPAPGHGKNYQNVTEIIIIIIISITTIVIIWSEMHQLVKNKDLLFFLRVPI